jgi:hypothetical protein
MAIYASFFTLLVSFRALFGYIYGYPGGTVNINYNSGPFSSGGSYTPGTSTVTVSVTYHF